MGQYKDITGEKYGKLTAIRPVERRTKSGGIIWLFECECGNTKEIPANSVRSGLVKSCGCLHKKHGDTRTRLFNIWVDMRMRCKHKGQKHWHDKGIKVCAEWDDYLSFKKWALSSGYKDGLTIDRIDSEGDYTPENCRWATYKEQSRNLSSNRWVTINGNSKLVKDWCEELKIVSPATVYRRVREYGWTYEKAITTPVRKPFSIVKDESENIHRVNKRIRPVVRTDANGNTRGYVSVHEAAVDISGCPSMIVRCCKGKQKTYRGYTWNYATEGS